MNHASRCSRLSGALLLAAVVAFAPGCTLFGDTFRTEQPLAEVTVVGKINIDTATVDSLDCAPGNTLFWGIARNTGDLDVEDVFIEIVALGAADRVLGIYRDHVFNGDAPPPGEGEAATAGTSLTVDQSGTFQICAPLSAGSVAGTTYRTDFLIIIEVE